MSATKTVMTVTSLATAMLFGGGIYLYMNYGTMAKNSVERYASRTLGVPVTIGRLDASLKDNFIAVTNFRIANPQGYHAPYAVIAEKVHIATGALGEGRLELKDIAAGGVEIFVEQGQEGDNLSAISANLKQAIEGKDAPAASDDPAAQDKKNILMTVGKLVMDEGQVHVLDADEAAQDEAAGKIQAFSSLRMADIGGGEGISPEKAIGQIWNRLARAALSVAGANGERGGEEDLAGEKIYFREVGQE